MALFPMRFGRSARGPQRARRNRPATRHNRFQSLGLDALEPRLVLAITLPIQDMSGLATAGYDVWVTGHGIPGWQPSGAPPLYLMSLDRDGSFAQTATAIASAESSGTMATITTQAPHGLTSGESVFIAGTSGGPNQPSYDGSYVITVPQGSPTTFTYTLGSSGLGKISDKGTVYTSTLLKSRTVTSVTTLNVTGSPDSGPPFATAEATTSAPHGLTAGQTIQISNVQGPAGPYADIYNGVFTVGQVSSATKFQYSYYFGTRPVPPGVGPSTANGTVTSAGIEPVKVSSLSNQSLTLDDSMTNISSRLFFFVAAMDSPPGSIPLNGIAPSDPAPPPFGPSSTRPTSVFDIMEFAYLPTGVTSTSTVATYITTAPHGLSAGDEVIITGVAAATGQLISEYNKTFTVNSVSDPMTFTVTGSFTGNQQGGGGTVTGTQVAGGTVDVSPSFSTFDVSAVDGFAIPMTLTASQVKAGSVSSVGINTGSGFTRQAIGASYSTFMANDPLGHVDKTNPASRDFSKLFYDGAVTGAAISGVGASWKSNTATFTWTAPLAQPLVAGETVTISGFTGSAVGFNGTFTVSGTTPPTTTSFTVTNTDASLTSGAGGTVTPEVFQSPFLPAGQFNAITAPKDWLGNQATSKSPPGSVANEDPLRTFWDDTIHNFFASGNTLNIYLGKDPTAPIYSGSSDGTQYTLTNKKSDGTIVNTFTFPKPTPDATTGQTQSLANALYVWSQPNPGSGDQGLLQDQIWMALCRGVALDGVNPAAINVQTATSTGWVPPVPGVQNPLGIATITTHTPHGLPINSTPNVVISGVSQTVYNGVRAVTVTGTNTFTFTYQPNAGNPYGTIMQAVVGEYDSQKNTTPVTVTMSPGGTVPLQDDVVYLTTISVLGYNGEQVVTAASGNTFTYSLPGNQSTLGTGNGGVVWGGLYAAGTGGTVDAGGSSTAWNDTTNWYTQHASTAFQDFQSVYCPYSKFLHYSTLAGTVDTTGTTSIFLHNAAYGFGEDENPIGNPYTGALVPSKLDGTVYDDSTVTIRLAPWGLTASRPAIDLNGDGIQDVVWLNETAGTYVGWVYDANGQPTEPVRVLIGTPWKLAAAGYFDDDNITDFVWRYTGSGANDGANVLWNMNADGTVKSNVGFGGTPTTSLQTSGDYNGDGITDLVWKMPSSDHLVWIMNAGGTVAATTAFATQSGAWQLARTGADYDADGDGNTDLVWFSGATHVVYLMDGAAAPTAATLPAGPAGSSLAATGDFNSDGISDLVWAAIGSSTVEQQLMGFTAGAPVVQSQNSVAGDSGTVVEDSAAFWGNNLVWRSATTGVDSVWTMLGSEPQKKKAYGGSLDWRLIRRPGQA